MGEKNAKLKMSNRKFRVLVIVPLVILAIVMMLNFFSGKKSLMEYLKFSGALVLGVVGICVLVFRSDIMRVLAWLAGFMLIVDGGRTMIHSFTYARRS